LEILRRIENKKSKEKKIKRPEKTSLITKQESLLDLEVGAL
jgi:hypothetical protein